MVASNLFTRPVSPSLLASDILNYRSLGDYVSEGVDCTTTLLDLLNLGLPVYIPAGTFLITSLTLPANSILFGIGDKSILKLANLTNTVGLNISSGCDLRNFLIDGNKTNQVGSDLHTISIASVSNVTLSHVKAINAKGDGFNISGTASELRILNCKSYSHLGNGLRVAGGSNILIENQVCNDSDAVSTGAGIALSSSGPAISSITLTNPTCRSNSGRGLALVGNGSRNVTDVLIANPNCSNNAGSGIHMINAERIIVDAGLAVSNAIDGVRVEGDVQYARINGTIAKGNTQFGIREVTAGTTPNNNGFIYNLCAANGTNVVTKVGAASFIV